MTKKRSHLRPEDRTTVIANPDLPGIQFAHQIKPYPDAAIFSFGQGSQNLSTNRFRFNKRSTVNYHDDPDFVIAEEWSAQGDEQFSGGNDVPNLLGEFDQDLTRLAQTAAATAADVGSGVVGFAAEAVPPIAEAAGAGAGIGTGFAVGAAEVGAVAVVTGATLVAVSDSAIQAPNLKNNSANNAPTNITLSVNVIRDGTTVPMLAENNSSGVKIGDLFVIDSDSVDHLNRLSLLPGPDAALFEIRAVLGSDQLTVIGHELYYIGPTPDFNQQPSYSIVVESTDSSSVTPLIFAKTLTIVVTIDAIQAVGWQESAWVSGATLYAFDDPTTPLIDQSLHVYASNSDDWLLGSAGNDFFSGMASGDIFIGGAGIDVVQLDTSVVPASGPIRLGFYPSAALQAPPDALIQADALPSLDGVLSWGNEVLIQAEQIRFTLPGESITRVFSTFPEELIPLHSDPADPGYLGTYRLQLSSEDDWVVFGDSNGVLDAGPGNDCVISTSVSGILSGGDGNDWLLAGDPTEDFVLAINQSTLLFGDAGNDVLVALAGHVDAWGGVGHDTFVLAKAKATLTVHDYDPSVDSIVWADLEGLEVFKSTNSDGSTTFFYSEVNDSLLQSTPVLQGSALSPDWWPQHPVDTICSLSLSSVTWITV